MRPVPWFLASIPVVRSDMLQRPSIVRLLDTESEQKRAILLAAPSGYGKTVALSQWAAQRSRDVPGAVGWVTLTARAADREDVLRGLLTAMANVARTGGDEGLRRQLTEVFESSSYEAAVAALMEIDPLGPFTIVIDDFQQARSAWRDTDMLELIEHGPQWLNFVLATTDPIGPEWSRLRVHDQVAVIGSNELAFSRADIAALAAVSGKSLSHSDVDEIVAATGGWPGAVRLALVAGDVPLPAATADLTDYIETSVLSRLRPDLAEFVLHTTVCARLDEPLAVSLSGQPDAGARLRECVSSGLFLEQFGTAEHVSYQWHSIFIRHCREILRRRRPEEWQRVNHIAAQALGDAYPLEAIEHAIRAGDRRTGFDTVADHWLELLLQSRSSALDEACVRLTDAFGEDPEVLMVRASCRAMAGDNIMAQLLFERAAQGTAQSASPRSGLIADLSTLLVFDDRERMTQAAVRAEAALRDRDLVSPRVYACALFVIGWADSRLRRSISRGTELLAASVHECTVLGLTEVAHRGRQNLAFAAAHAGEFDRALAALRVAEESAQASVELWLSHDGDGIERFTAGWVSFWRGEMNTALDYLVSASSTVGVGYPDTARMTLAFTAAALGTEEVLGVAEAAVSRMPDVDTHGVPWNSYQIAARARLCEARMRSVQATNLATEIVGREHVPMVSAMLSGMCRRLGATELAGTLARQALASPVPGYVAAYASLTLALLAWQSGDRSTAHRHTEEMLAAAVDEQVRYQFIDNADAPCRELLAAHLPTTSHREFLTEALVLCEQPKPAASSSRLTAREREVLAYLRTAMTSQEIATQMNVSLNTLKTHQRSIYRKLGVANRRQAIKAVHP